MLCFALGGTCNPGMGVGPRPASAAVGAGTTAATNR
jgi:hypothetical protein